MIVVKVGGAKGIDHAAVAKDIATMWKQDHSLIMVHGGSYETNQISEALGNPPQFLTHPGGTETRLTDRRTLEIFEMVYCGLVNKRLVELLQRDGVNAVGLSGLDGRVFEGRRKKVVKYLDNGKVKLHRGGYTGAVEHVNTALLFMLLEAGYLPVLTPPAISTEGEAINTDGDIAAAMLAVALEAEALVFLSNVPGLLRSYPDEKSLIPEIPTGQVQAYLEVAKGRMKKKVLGASEAVSGGVGRVIFADGRIASPIQKALAGQGTVVY